MRKGTSLLSGTSPLGLGRSVFSRTPGAPPEPVPAEPVSFAGPIDTSGSRLPGGIYDAFEAALLAPVDTWLNRTRRLSADHDDLAALRIVLLEASAEARLDALATLLADAMALAHLVGRASVFDEAEEDGVSFADDAVARGIQFQGGPFDEAVEFLRQKVALPQNEWQELMHHGHDRAFVVAGITNQQVAEDIQALVARRMQTRDINGFRSDLDELIADGRWTGNPDMVITGDEDEETLARKTRYRAWRSRTIFHTNLSTAHAAGRLKQQRALRDVLPFFQYAHAATRTPRRARPHHVRLDGLTLPQDDPTWRRIYAPNGWLCSCAIRAVTRRMADRAPDALRQPPTEAEINLAVPPEWQYQPGDSWERGLVPQQEAGLLDRAQQARPVQQDLPPLADLAAPMTLPDPLPSNATDEDIAARFLAQFGASLDRGVLYRDRAGQQLVVSRQLLTDGKGNLKVRKRGRDRHMDRLAATLLDPDEIWLDWSPISTGGARLERTYLRHDSDAQLVTGFVWRRDHWDGTTAATLTDRKGRPNERALERRRHGALLYRREEGR